MADYLRLRKWASAPFRALHDELVVWAEDDGSLHTMDEDGTETEVGAGGNGGSQSFEHVVVPIAFDTADLVIPESGPAGILIAELNPGDWLLSVPKLAYVSVTTAWDGTTPQLNFCVSGDRGDLPGTPPDGSEAQADLSVVDSDLTLSGDATILGAQALTMFGGGAYVAQAESIYAFVDDGAGGDPESSQGEGSVHLFIYRAT